MERPSEGAAGDSRPAKIIKRYTNRKLYDTVESRYVTLDEIAEMVKAGSEVQIVDNRTKEDLTSVTLAQIIFEEEKKTSRMPLAMLRDIIRTGGEKITEFIEKAADIAGRAREGVDPKNSKEAAKDFIRTSRRSFEEWQKNLDERVHRTYETVTGLPTLHREVQALRDKLAELEKKLDEQK
jgi:polyhydroxyalkanoate synthesis repressor PhaR